MAHTINERPAEISFSKNEIRYVYTISDLNRAGLFFSVKLRYRLAGADNYTELQLAPMLPDSTGKVVVTLQQIIDSLVKYQMPEIDVLVNNAASQVLRFHIYTREITNADADPAWNEHEGTKERIALKGGIEKNRHSRNNFFNYQSTNKNWYSWQPTYRNVFKTQPLYLSCFIPYEAGQTYRLIINWVNTDYSTNSTNRVLTLANYSSFYHINVNALILNIQEEDKTLLQYEVSLIKGFSQIYSPVTFYLNDKHLYAYHDFVYNNSLGGFDSIRAQGETSFSIERNFEDAERGFAANNWDSKIKDAYNVQLGINYSRNYKGDIGYMQSASEQLSLVELLIAQLIYEQVDSRWIPILQMQKSSSLGSETATKWALPIEWRYAETNEVFTPNINLGIGNDTETYP